MDESDVDAIPDEKMFGAFELGLTLLHVEPDDTLAELSERDTDTLLVICDQVAKRTRDADTVRGTLRCALALATGNAVASRAALSEGVDCECEHRALVKCWLLARSKC
jgi:hypothetical protein